MAGTLIAEGLSLEGEVTCDEELTVHGTLRGKVSSRDTVTVSGAGVVEADMSAHSFTIEGQEPFVATKGFLVQVPKRLVYSMETVGDRPSLRFEVLMANSGTMYPADETPPQIPGIRFEKTRVANSKGSYDEANVPYIDYNLTIAGKQKPKKNPTQFLGDALVVESEHDEIIPHPAVANYIAALANAHSLTYRVIEGADHALSQPAWEQAYTEILVNWMAEMIKERTCVATPSSF